MKRSDFFISLLALPLISLFVKQEAKAEVKPFEWPEDKYCMRVNRNTIPCSVKYSPTSITVHTKDFKFDGLENCHVSINGEWVTIRPLTPAEILRFQTPIEVWKTDSPGITTLTKNTWKL